MATQQILIDTLTEDSFTYEGKVIPQWIVNGEWKSAKGKWNGDWAIGGNAKGLFEQKTGQTGQVFKTIKCPPELNTSRPGGGGNYGGGGSTLDPVFIQNISHQMSLLTQAVQSIATKLGASPATAVVAQPAATAPAPSKQPEPAPASPPAGGVQPTPSTGAPELPEIKIEDIPF